MKKQSSGAIVSSEEILRRFNVESRKQSGKSHHPSLGLFPAFHIYSYGLGELDLFTMSFELKESRMLIKDVPSSRIARSVQEGVMVIVRASSALDPGEADQLATLLSPAEAARFFVSPRAKHALGFLVGRALVRL